MLAEMRKRHERCVTHDKRRVLVEIRRQLRESGCCSLSDVDVDFDGETVTLSGRVPTFYVKQVVQTIAGNVVGVQHVLNQTVVKPPWVISMEIRKPSM